MMPNIVKPLIRSSILFSFSMLFMALSPQAQAETLYNEYSRAGEVRIHISEPKEVGISGKIDTAALKQTLEKVLLERKSIRFKSVPSAAEAELIVEADLQGFYFSEQDPVDMLVGVGMAAMDAAKQDHFARLEADFRVVDAKSSRVLWKDRLIASLTDATMTEAESKLKILDRAADVFVRSAFGKAKRNR